MTGTAGVLLPSLLAGLAAVVLVGPPGTGAARLRRLRPATSPPARPVLLRPAGRFATPMRALPGALAPSGLPLAGLALAGLALAGLALAGPVVAALAAVLGAVGLRQVRRSRERAARERERARATEACAALAADLRAGRTPAEALAAAARIADGPTASVLHGAAATAALGGDVPAALTATPLSGRPPAVPALLAGLAACWAVCATTGSGLASAVERLEEGQRAAQAHLLAVQSELAGPRATAALLAVLPLVGVLLAAGLGADPLGVLLHSPVGNVCLAAGVGLDLLGVLWTGRLVARAGGSP